MKKLISLCAILVFVVAFSAVAYAGTSVTGLFNTDGSNTLLSDNSAEFFFNVDGSVSTNGTPTITVGDIIVGIVGINTIGATTIGDGTTYNEVTAVFASKISAASDVDLGPAGTDDSFGSQNIDLWQFEEVPLDAGDAGFFDWSLVNASLSNDGTQFAAVFEDTANDYTRSDGLNTGYLSAIGGTMVLAVGIIPLNGDFLSAIAPLDLGAFATIPASTAVDNSNIALDGTITFQNWAPLFFNNNITGGNGGFSSPEASSSWPVYDNLDFTVTATAIPEPATISLVGLGLLGAAFFGYRRRK